MLVIGLTGGIGSGKTTASHMFAELGAAIIDADVIAHQLVEPGSDTLDEIIAHFGKSVLCSDGSLDRGKLAQHVFEHPDDKNKLEAVLHPQIESHISQQISQLRESANEPAYAIVVIPLLIETHFSELVDRVLVIDALSTQQINRVQQRDQRSETEIRNIMQNQVDRETRLQHADDIIDNNGTMDQLNHEVQQLHAKYAKIAVAV